MTENRREYSQKIHDDANEWHALMLSGLASKEEKEKFKIWLNSDPRHADAYDQTITLWEALGQLTPEQIRFPVQEKIANQTVTRFAFVRDFLETKKKRILPVAACIVAILLVPLSSMLNWTKQTDKNEVQDITVYTTEVAGSQTINLDEGSVLTLGADSKIEVALSLNERRVTIVRGAALFDVETIPSRPFFVEANKFTGKVTGTVFDVTNNGGVVRMSVAEGSVTASHPVIIDGKPSAVYASSKVQAGEQVLAFPDNGLSATSTFSLDDFATWREGRLKYKGATLPELIADANRFSERSILLDTRLDSIRFDPVSMAFNSGEIERMIHSLPHFFDVKVQDDGVGPILILPK